MYLSCIISLLLFIFPLNLRAMEEISEGEMDAVYASSGLTFALKDLVLNPNFESIKFTAVDNMDTFGSLTAEEGSLTMSNYSSILAIDGMLELDSGTYLAPDEHYTVVDRKGDNYEEEPFLWHIDDDIPRPLDNADEVYAVVLGRISNFRMTYDSISNISICQQDLGSLQVEGLSMPDFMLDGTPLPGTVFALFPYKGSEPALEIRTRLALDRISFGSKSESDTPSFQAEGIYLAESFSSELPSHMADTGSTMIDTSGWGGDIQSEMYSGYFVVGNLNQVNFADVTSGGSPDSSMDDMQLTDGDIEDSLHNPPVLKDGGELVGLIARPTTINIGTNGDKSFILVSTSMHGSMRIASLAGHGGHGMGPVAVDGLRVKMLTVEFPGEHKRFDNGSWRDKGRVPPEQYNYLYPSDP